MYTTASSMPFLYAPGSPLWRILSRSLSLRSAAPRFSGRDCGLLRNTRAIVGRATCSDGGCDTAHAQKDRCGIETRNISRTVPVLSLAKGVATSDGHAKGPTELRQRQLLAALPRRAEGENDPCETGDWFVGAEIMW